MDKGDFSLVEFESILRGLLDKGYAFIRFGGESVNSPFILLRHDIDFSPVAAAKLARMESDLNIKGTFFIHLSSAFYNPLSPKFLSLFKEIRDLGHSIALHHEATIYPDHQNLNALMDNIDRERAVLEKALAVRTNVVSFHNPTEFVRNLDLSAHGIINTYAPKYYNSDIKYVADSNMKWRDGYILDVADGKRSVQWLVHPGHWDGMEKGGFMDRILNALRNQVVNGLDSMAEYNYFWKEHVQYWKEQQEHDAQ